KTGVSNLAWSIEGSSQQINYDVGRDTETARVRAVLDYQFDPQFKVGVTAGVESNNYVSEERQRQTTYGASFEWAPTERTQVSGSVERRFFGNGHEFTVRHRTRLMSFSIKDRKDVTTTTGQILNAGSGVGFDLLFAALASRIPDPVARAQEVERLLQQGGIPPDLGIATGVLTTRVLLERRREASVALLGVANTVAFTAFRTDTQSLGVGAGTADDFALASTGTQRGVSADWSHALSSLSSLSLFATWIRATAASSSTLSTTERSLRLFFSTQIGPKTFGTFGARHVRFDSATDIAPGYRENAITATVTLLF
ncbi:MAG TPA: TIGR03016 family PEP-CTERM system-associated outer membrane protein, partial [Burkholderiales bacterium]|nr:TIGR03016 family PEP-CTERM system-associated outer membrane protein [Burkholderiales bacterium]